MTDDDRSRPMVHALLADGTTVCIRAVTPRDRAQLQGLYEEMSPEHLRMRFFAAAGAPPRWRPTGPVRRRAPDTGRSWPRRTAR